MIDRSRGCQTSRATRLVMEQNRASEPADKDVFMFADFARVAVGRSGLQQHTKKELAE